MVKLNIQNRADYILNEIRDLREFVEKYHKGPGKDEMLEAIDMAETEMIKVKVNAKHDA